MPSNCKFELDDASLDWTYPENSFDFIHFRYLLGSIADYPKLYKQAYRCLKPDGWLEHTDFSVNVQSDDGSLPKGGVWDMWNEFFRKAGELTGKTFRVTEGDRLVGFLKEAGFTGSINNRNFKLPLGNWPADPKQKEIGSFNKLSVEHGLEGYALFLGTKVLGWSYEEVQVLITGVRKALETKSYHAYYPRLVNPSVIVIESAYLLQRHRVGSEASLLSSNVSFLHIFILSLHSVLPIIPYLYSTRISHGSITTI